MKDKILLALGIIVIVFSSCLQQNESKSEKEKFVDKLISKMTVQEKVGQMTLYSSGEDPTVPVLNPYFREEISRGADSKSELSAIFELKEEKQKVKL
ncbi:MAG: hypothetical protein ABFS12_13820 [Bacteroidota bacterium]